MEVIPLLEKKLNHPVDVYIKADIGYGRTGINAEDFVSFQKILDLLKPGKNLIFLGFLAHAGHTYHAKSTAEIKTIMNDSIRKLLALKTFLRTDFPMLQLSYGDTPSCSIAKEFDGIDEIRPGNFVFYDEMQHQLDVCSRADIAVALACPIVAKHPERGEVVIHGGGVHLSKERIADKSGESYYGVAVTLNNYEWSVNDVIGRVTKLSQEHGIIKPNDNIQKLNIGDMVAVLPVHSCLTANLMKGFTTTDGTKLSTM
jgi:D-serine deaminase-like pyridoxal phosphate-dependent protein